MEVQSVVTWKERRKSFPLIHSDSVVLYHGENSSVGGPAPENAVLRSSVGKPTCLWWWRRWCQKRAEFATPSFPPLPDVPNNLKFQGTGSALCRTFHSALSRHLQKLQLNFILNIFLDKDWWALSFSGEGFPRDTHAALAVTVFTVFRWIC